ncbi:MAG: TIGR02452 family protein [Clostridiales bacterium]|nr:TIGR02452 family protein [Clostridiales bacterium]
MDRKAMARETLEIMRQGYYEPAVKNEAGEKPAKKQISIKEAMEKSVEHSTLISPAEGEKILEKYRTDASCLKPETRVENISAIEAIRILAGEGKTDIGVLNFASAKNPGGGFLNGAKAQEESLTVSSTLYPTLTAHEEYYKENRAHSSMMYLDYGIYSPDVVFFRDGGFRLAETPVKASVLTLPAVNMGQVLLKGENAEEAKRVMRRRMKLVLGIFAEKGARHLVLGAYGCGVFRNAPREVAIWWRELLEGGMGQYFDSVFYAVLDHSKEKYCIRAFQE